MFYSSCVHESDKSLLIPRPDKLLDLYDIAQSITITQLGDEHNMESLFRDQLRLAISDSLYYILEWIPITDKKRLLLFDHSGKHFKTLNGNVEGSDAAFPFGSDFQIYEKRIEILNSYKSEILTFDAWGNFINKSKIPDQYTNFYKMNDSLYFLSSDLPNKENESKNINLYDVRHNQIVNRCLDILTTHTANYYQHFFKGLKTVYFIRPYDPTVYEVLNHMVETKYNLQFQSGFINNKEIAHTINSLDPYSLNSIEKVQRIESFFEFKNFIIITYTVRNAKTDHYEVHFAFVNQRSKEPTKTFKVSFNFIAQVSVRENLPVAADIQNNYLYFFIEPHNFKQFKLNTKDEVFLSRVKSPTLSNDDNLLLMKVELKPDLFNRLK